MIAFYALLGLLFLAFVPDKFVASALFGGLIWVMLLGDTLDYVFRWVDPTSERTFLGMLVRWGVLIAIPAGFLVWRLLL